MSEDFLFNMDLRAVIGHNNEASRCGRDTVATLQRSWRVFVNVINNTTRPNGS